MNSISIGTFGIVLILAYALVCEIFLNRQADGKSLADPFDKAFMWGSSLFIIGYGLDAVTNTLMG